MMIQEVEDHLIDVRTRLDEHAMAMKALIKALDGQKGINDLLRKRMAALEAAIKDDGR